jgi:hypothetical protein
MATNLAPVTGSVMQMWLQLLLDPFFFWERKEVFRDHGPGALL